jgi:Major tropism determinant N-terminal domain
MAQNALIKVRRDTAADWTAANPTLEEGEFGWESDTNFLKIGDGVTAWTTLDYFADFLAVGYLIDTNNLSDVASVSTSRTNLGLGTGDSPQFTAVNVGHASDTTITRVSAGVVAVEGVTLATVGSGLIVPTTQSGTSYTAVLGDAPAAQNYMGYIQFTNAAAIAFTIPPNASVAFPIGTTIAVEQTTAGGIITLTPGAGVTLNSRGALLATAGQYAVAQVKKVATNTWTVIGDVA